MLYEIFEFLEKFVMLIVPIYLIFVIINQLYFSLDRVRSSSWIGAFKWGFSFLFTFLIVASVFYMTAFDIIHIGNLWKEYEQTHYLEPWIKSLSFLVIEFVWQIIGVVLISFVWCNFCWKQIIPGEGGIKNRIKVILGEMKTNVKLRK